MSEKNLIALGASFGVLHVLLGPDHLSALATLSSGNSWRAVFLGLRWGVGHSSGLLIVGGLFLLLKDSLIDVKQISHTCEVLVGFFMLAIGLYAILGSLKQYKERKAKKEESGLSLSGGKSPYGDLSSPRSLEEEFSTISTYCPFIDMKDPVVTRFVSLIIGLLHGAAGPGHILGILPAIEMENLKSSLTYLVSFVLSSTLSMALFSAIYGEATKRLGAASDYIELSLSLFSGTCSVICGTIWLTTSLFSQISQNRISHTI